MKTIRLIWTFYKSFLLLSAIITAFCMRAFWLHGFASFSGIFWCKLASLGVTYYFIDVRKKNEYYYYQNLGVPRSVLWCSVLISDFTVFIFLLILLSGLR